MDYTDRSILLVDDEKPVLNSLKRLLRPLRCRVMTAESAKEGLALLEHQPVDLVISDMRMPEISGEVFLQKVAERWPETERIVMTGFSDTQSTIDAINKGKVSRFLMKPWQDEDGLKVVQKGFELAQLREQNSALQQLTQKKTKELEVLNTELEDKVKRRTEQLEASHLKLISSYRATVRMFSAITARRLGQDSHKGVQLNTLLVRTARLTPLTGKALKQLYYAWQLRNIGKLGFADELIQQPYITLSAEYQRQFQQHPLRAKAATVLVAPLFPAGEIIVQHKEYLDGSGYPKGLKSEEISYSAQLLCVVNDYVELISGLYQKRLYSSHEAISYLKEYAAERYNADIVEHLSTVVDQLVAEGEVTHEQGLTTSALVPGMVLSRDLLTIQDVLLLGAGQRLDSSAIARLSEMEQNLEEQFEVFVRQEVC